MSAPLGNRFWEVRSSHGRKPKFKTPKALWNACCEYFDWYAENPLIEMKAFAYEGMVTQEPLPKMRAMSIVSLCIFLDITRETWNQYGKKSKGFSDMVKQVENIIYSQKFQGASAGLLNSSIITRDLGLSEKTDVNHGVQESNPLTALLGSLDGNSTGLPNGNS